MRSEPRYKIGDRIQNRWEIYKILYGGMGIVYVSYDHEHHDAFAAKTFQDEIFIHNPQIAERFMQEALAWVNLDVHQNVTQARFVQYLEDNPFLFLEYISGGDLSGWIGTPLLTDDLSQVLRFAIQFCDGMMHAYTKGIQVHRDIKPQNCLITEDRTLKVTDFGLAKVFDDASVGDWKSEEVGEGEKGHGRLSIGLSRTGKAAGTCTHMAPEQFDDAKHVDVRADIYSFGVMLFQMVTGLLPFTVQARTREEAWEKYRRAHQTQLPQELITPNLQLRTVVETCLAKDPADRFADFDAVRKELTGMYEQLTGEPAPQPAAGIELDASQLNSKGMSLSVLGRYEEALGYFERALELDPRFDIYGSNRGNALRRLGRHEEALACFDRALQLNLHAEGVWSNKGATLTELGRCEEALTCFKHALELKPLDVAAWSDKGVVLRNLGRREEALVCFDRALALNPRAEPTWLNRGSMLGELGRHEEALLCFDHALGLNPHDEGVWYAKGLCLGKLGRHEEALCFYDQAIVLNTGYEDAWFNKGMESRDLGRMHEALVCFDRVVEINPRDEGAWYHKGWVLGSLGRMEEAVTCFDRALELNPRDEQAWHQKAWALRGLRRKEDAVACYDRAIALNPRDAHAWLSKGIALGELGRCQDAIACFDRAIEINPNDGQVWYNRGVTLGNSGRLREALVCFEKAQRLGDPQAAQAIAMCRKMLGQQ